MLNALIQRGSVRPGFDPFEVLPDDVLDEPSWASDVDTITEDGLAGSDTITEDGLGSSDTITEITI